MINRDPSMLYAALACLLFVVVWALVWWLY